MEAAGFVGTSFPSVSPPTLPWSCPLILNIGGLKQIRFFSVHGDL